MVWTCNACTFRNSIDGASRCDMCETKRPEGTTNRSFKTTQQTLFGTRAEVASGRKRKATSAAAATAPSTSQQQQQKRFRHHSFLARVRPRSSIISEQEVQTTLENVFGLHRLRNLQPQVVDHALKQKSQLVVMATGGGKSLCYQLPACLLGGLTIVISPLIALMLDQVKSLKDRKIPAACICSSQTNKENQAVLQQVHDPNHKNPLTLLYITPESIQTDRMREVLKQLYKDSRLAFFAVDEAHCLSSWGHDFRPAYRRLSWLRSQFPKVPCMACTATATPQVIRDIQTILQLQEAPLHKGSFDRPNIFYKVKYKDALDNPLQDLIQYIKRRHNDSCVGDHCSGIVYVHKRADTSMIANAISRAGIRAEPYHAGLKDAQRKKIQEEWSNNQVQVAVATVAFGMGIDLAHVRYVIHWTLSKTVEGFYQESGRAGRDGLPSQSVLYFCQDDARKFQWLIRQQNSKQENSSKDNTTSMERKLESLEQMVQYCTTPACRRNALIRHFGGNKVDCQKTCDYCRDPKKVERAIQSANVLKDVKQPFLKKTKDTWDGQWKAPHGDLLVADDDEEEGIARDWGDEYGMVGDLRVTGPLSFEGDFDNAKPKTKLGFRKASTMLAKYEALEMRESNEQGGFVKFRPKKDLKPVSSVKIPDHFLSVLPNPLRQSASTKKEETSKDIAAKAKELREDLDKLNKEREARMKALLAKRKNKKSSSTYPPPPAQLTFGSQRQKS